MSKLHKQELEFVAGALTSAHKLQDLLDRQAEWTAAMRREVHEQVAALTGYLLVANLEHTGDAENVGNTMHDILEEAVYGLAA